MKIHKGDEVIVISGKDKGKKGKVIKALPEEQLVIVENVNIKKKHQKPKASGKKGEKIEIPLPISVSSIMLICKNCGKPSRINYKVSEKEKKIRICKKCGLEV